jgi:arginyl-tRNA synthetase
MEKVLREILNEACKRLVESGQVSVEIEIPKEDGFGDLSTPVAMGLARTLKRAPRKIAEEIVGLIGRKDIFDKIEIAGPGFINFYFSETFILNELRKVLLEKDSFFAENVGNGKRIQIEFVSANPTGPLHLGHGRGAALGAALANLLTETGFKIEKEFYINDAGRQVRMLGLSVFAKYQQLCGKDFSFPEDGYHGDYVEDLAEEFRDSAGEKYADRQFDEVSAEVIDFAYKKMLDQIKHDLSDFGVVFDSWQSERELYAAADVTKAIDELRARGHIFEEDGATWFRSTEFGDDKDRVLIKKDGDYTYFTPDIAYHRKKFEKGFDELIDIWGADHHGYIPRMQAAAQALGHPRESLRVLLVQLVSLLSSSRCVK